MIGVAVAAFALVLVVAYAIAKPFLVAQTDGEREAAQLREDRARALAQIRDLDMEFATGKLSDEEYRSQRAHRVAEADAAEVGLSELEAAAEAADEDEGEPALDDLERRIAARKRALEGAGCPDCGTATESDDRFCRSCGARLASVGTR